MQRLIAIFASLVLASSLINCTSNSSKDESDSAIEETASVDGELEKVEGSDTELADGAPEGFVDEQLPEDALGESTASVDSAPTSEVPVDPAAMDAPAPDMMASEVAPPASDVASTDTTQPADTGSTDFTDTSSGFAAVDPGAPAGFEAVTPEATPEPAVTESKPAPAPSVASTSKPLEKIKSAPFREGGELLNAVYIARPGDTFRKISKTIYGNTSKAKALADANPEMGMILPGDRIYYNSPVRPTDEEKMLTFYEDSGIPAETYVSKSGDNLRTVAKNLLGYERGWREIWATNPGLESNRKLAAGTEFKYWKGVSTTGEAAPVSNVAANTTPSAPEPVMPPADMNELPPPPDMAQADLPPPPADLPPPPAMEASVAQNAPPPPDLPPPPPAEAMNPPPPPPIAKKAPKELHAEEGGLDPDLMMTLGGAAAVALAAAGLIVVRKRRQQKEMQNAFNDTQVGT